MTTTGRADHCGTDYGILAEEVEVKAQAKSGFAVAEDEFEGEKVKVELVKSK